MAEEKSNQASAEPPKVVYLLRASDGRVTKMEMDHRGYFTHVFIRNLAEKMGLPAQAISLHIQPSEGDLKQLDPTRMLDEQVMRIATVSKEEVSITPIEVRIDEKAIIASQSKEEQPNISQVRSRHFRRTCIVIRDTKKADPVDVMRLARTCGATKRGGFLWLDRRYLVKMGQESERYYTYEALNRNLGFAI